VDIAPAELADGLAKGQTLHPVRQAWIDSFRSGRWGRWGPPHV